MSGLSNYGKNFALDIIFGAEAVPTSYYVALCTAVISDTMTGTTIPEVSGGSYARVEIDTGDFVAAASGVKRNDVEIAFPEATGAWGTVRYFAICDVATDGEVIAWGQLATPVTVNTGGIARFNPNSITITLE